jgi:hypothetical protein
LAIGGEFVTSDAGQAISVFHRVLIPDIHSLLGPTLEDYSVEAMAKRELEVQAVLLEIIMRVRELEALVKVTDSATERRSLEIAIAELRQVLEMQVC